MKMKRRACKQVQEYLFESFAELAEDHMLGFGVEIVLARQHHLCPPPPSVNLRDIYQLTRYPLTYGLPWRARRKARRLLEGRLLLDYSSPHDEIRAGAGRGARGAGGVVLSCGRRPRSTTPPGYTVPRP